MMRPANYGGDNYADPFRLYARNLDAELSCLTLREFEIVLRQRHPWYNDKYDAFTPKRIALLILLVLAVVAVLVALSVRG